LPILSSCINISAQTRQAAFSFLNFGINEGLPSSEVYDLYQDPKTGLLWIATDRGLVKYDGYNFITYTVDDGLTDNVILYFTPDSFGNLWFHPLNSLPCYLDNKGSFKEFKYNKKLKESGENLKFDLKIASLFFDKNKTLSLTYQHFFGLTVIDSAGKVTWKGFVPGRGPEKFINFLPQNAYYYFSEKPEVYYSYPIQEIARCTIHKIKDSLFVLTDGKEIKIYNRLTLKKTIQADSSTSHSGRINDSLFWVSYKEGGVNFYDLNGNLKFHFLEKDIVSKVIVDHEGGLWFSTLSNGVYYLKNTHIKTVIPDQLNRLTSMSSFRENLFLGYYTGQIYWFNTKNHEYHSYNKIKLHSPAYIQSDTIKNCLYAASREYLGWSGTNLKGSKGFTYGAVRVIDENKNGEVYFASFNGFLKKHNDTVNVYYTNIRVRDLSIIEDEIFLAGSDGLYKYINNKSIKIDKKELNFRIEDIDRFREGIVCATMGGGLVFYKRSHVFSIKKNNGLLSNLSTEVFVQNDSVIWLATPAGLNRIAVDKKYNYKISGYTTADGLVSNEIVDIDRVGDTIWIASKKGLNFIHRNDTAIDQTPKLFLAIEKVMASGATIPFPKNKLQLSYLNNNVEVFFTAISFSRNRTLIYRYKLGNENGDWNTTYNRSIVFPALPYGNHVLEIQASIDNIHWIEKVKLEISIEPPYWRTWWFILLLLLLCGFITAIIFIYRLKQQKLKTTALDMEMKALRAQMNPHFIFNSLASIQHFILKGNTDDSNKYLTKFSKLIRGVLENSKSELVSIKKELEIVNLYIELEQLRVKPFQYHLILDRDLNIADLQIPPLIIQPFIENAIWHGLEPSDGERLLRLELKIVEDKLYCVIEDNGVGRNHHKNKMQENVKIKDKSFGIEITQERINALKKTHNIEVRLKFIDKFNEAGHAIGTRVDILLPIINLKQS
jgi:ligand-binding sensor domain-containing protein